MFKKIIVKGSNYDMGFELGKFFKKPIQDTIETYIDKLKNPSIAKVIENNIENVKNTFPHIYEELLGKAEGSEVDFKALFLMHSPEVLDKVDGCTTAIYKLNDRVLFSHNEDDKGCNHENTVLVKHLFEDGRYVVGLDTFDKLTGSCFGFNSFGLVYSCNFIYHEDINTDYLSRYVVVRDVIESKDIDECLFKLNKYPTASPFSMNLLDTNSLRVINVENDYFSHYITEIQDKYARSNHFLCKDGVKMSNSSRNRNINAKARIADLTDNASINDLIDVLSLESENADDCILKDPNKFNDPKVALTIANYSYDTFEKEFILNDYIDHSTIKFTFESFE